MSRRKKYSPEFKQEALRLLMSKTVEQVARELRVPRSALYRWRRQYDAGETQMPDDTQYESLTTDEREELHSLRKRVVKLETEREILKKFAAFCARENE